MDQILNHTPSQTRDAARSRQRVNAGGGPSSLNLFQNNEPSTPSTDRIATAVPAPRSFGGGGQSFAQKQPMSREARESNAAGSSESFFNGGASSSSAAAGNGNVGPTEWTSIKSGHGRVNSTSNGSRYDSSVAASMRWSGSEQKLKAGSPYTAAGGSARRQAGAEGGLTSNSIYGSPNKTASSASSPFASPVGSSANRGGAATNIHSPAGSAFQPSVRVSRPPGGHSSWSPGWK